MATLGTFTAGQVLTAAELNDIGTWQTYTPVLSAATTNPNLGSTAVIEGHYAQINDIVIFTFRFDSGGTGISAGSGEYRVSLPVNAATSGFSSFGSGWVYSAAFEVFSLDNSPGVDKCRLIVNPSPISSTNFAVIGAGVVYAGSGVYRAA